MQKIFTNVYNALYRAEFVVTAIGLTLVIFFVFFAAVFRWVGMPIQWATDIAQLLFAWIVFLGADLACKENRHIGIEIFEQRFNIRVQVGLKIIWAILIIIFLGICFYFGIILCFGNYLRRFNTINISYSWMTASVPVGSFLMLITFIKSLLDNIAEFRRIKGIIK